MESTLLGFIKHSAKCLKDNMRNLDDASFLKMFSCLP